MMIILPALFTGICPTLAMIACSLVVMINENLLSDSVEKYFQNFSAGLIVGAVACDLIPLVSYSIYENDISFPLYVICLALGFTLGFLILHCSDLIVSTFENRDIEDIVISTCNQSKPSTFAVEMKNSEHLYVFNKLAGNYSSIEDLKISNDSDFEDSPADNPAFEPEPESISLSLNAFSQTTDHKKNISKNIESLVESIDTIGDMMDKIIEIVDAGDSNDNEEDKRRATRLSEELSENIDRECHLLQYKLDFCRRLLQGSFTTIGGSETLEKWGYSRLELKKRLFNLKYIANHLLEHIVSGSIDADQLREMHEHMHDMDHQIEKLHASVETASFKWKKRKNLPLPEKGIIENIIINHQSPFKHYYLSSLSSLLSLGTQIPSSLILPVVIDSIIDGFVIGVVTQINLRAGIILAIATSIEMAFLGIAVAVRVKRCTASSVFVRYLAIIVPPLFVVLFAITGSCIGNLSSTYTSAFLIFIALGIYCLLNLVFDELLVDARNGLSEVPWEMNMMVFLGLFFVITMSSF